MFTGIVEELGEVRDLGNGSGGTRLTVRGATVLTDAAHGSSISVNGVCLTVVTHDTEEFTVDVMAETLQRSSLGSLRPGDSVNLERAMAADGRFGGHIVQGHVDGTGTVVSRTVPHQIRAGLGQPGSPWEVVRIALSEMLARYVVEKGSITVDGVSLTVSALGRDDDRAWFEVSLIPTTLELTTLGTIRPGATVNLEVDVLAKYVERLLVGRLAGGLVEDQRGR